MVTCHDMSRLKHYTYNKQKVLPVVFSQVHPSSALKSNIARHNSAIFEETSMECWNGNGSLRAGRKSTIGRAVTWTHQDAGPWSSYNAACAVRAYASSSPTARTVDWAKNDWAVLRRRQAHVVRLVYGAECVHGGCTGSSAAHLSAGRMACSATRAR